MHYALLHVSCKSSLIISGFATCFCLYVIRQILLFMHLYVHLPEDCGGWGHLISKPLEWISFESSLSLSNVCTAFVKGFKAEPRSQERLILSTNLPQSFWQPNYKNVFSPYLFISRHHPLQPLLSELHRSTKPVFTPLFFFYVHPVLCYKCLCSSFLLTSDP